MERNNKHFYNIKVVDTEGSIRYINLNKVHYVSFPKYNDNDTQHRVYVDMGDSCLDFYVYRDVARKLITALDIEKEKPPI